jgi:predicted  nucleic acid-binding Zn-ribbon protein
MLTSANKRFILPFSNRKDPACEMETAAVFAVAEFERNKGGGIINRQTEEKIIYLAKVCYPLWLVPKNDLIFVFDGFYDSNHYISYLEAPSATGFMERLEANSKPRENYNAFLLDHSNYFLQSIKEKQFIFRNLITDQCFKDEFNVYRKEAAEITAQVNAVLLPPILEESTISSIISEFEKVQSTIRDETQKIPECMRLVNKITSQYLTELDYAAEAVTDEMNTKIKALEEYINPKIAKLNKEYKVKREMLTERFDKELESLQKLKTKILKSIEINEVKNRLYQRETKIQSIKKHTNYEKRWKEKIKRTKRELKELKKELKEIENNIKKLSKQKKQDTSKLNFELDGQIKSVRQPLLDLEVTRDAKIRIFKHEVEKLFKQEKPVLEDLNRTLKIRESVKANFEVLCLKDQGIKNPSLFYIPFYVVCYEMGLTRRYLMLGPSIISSVDFSAKLKGILGMSKKKELFVPRFKSITSLIAKVEDLTKQNSRFESQLCDLIQRNNLLNTTIFKENVTKGLMYLKHLGWLSEKEQQTLTSRLTI